MIRGLSEVRRCPRLGNLRLGLKVPVQGKESVTRPKEVEYFILDPATGSVARDKQLLEQFKSLYGDKPTAIKIMFPPVDKDIFFAQWYKRYGSSTLLKCKGDAEEATCSLPEFAQGLEILGQDAMGLTRVKCLGSECIYQQKRECNRVGALQVLLPDLDAIGVWQISTGSYNSIVNINSALDWLKGLCGRYQMIPVTLLRMPVEIAHTGPDGKQSKGKHYVLQVDMQASLAKLQQAALVAPEKTMLAALPAPDDSMPGDEPNDKPIEVPGPATAPVEPVVEKAAKVFDAKELKIWEPGDLGRFGVKQNIAMGLMKTIKQCYDSLGHERFSYCAGGEGWAKVSEINSLEKLAGFVNVLLSEKKTKEAEE